MDFQLINVIRRLSDMQTYFLTAVYYITDRYIFTITIIPATVKPFKMKNQTKHL